MRAVVVVAIQMSLAAGILAQEAKEDLSRHDLIPAREAKLILTYRAAGDYAALERLYGEMLASRAGQPESAAPVRNALANLLREVGRNTEARRLFSQVADSAASGWRERLDALIGLADLDRQQGKWNSSLCESNEALEMARTREDHDSEKTILRGLGLTWLEAGSPARAEPLLRRSLRMVEMDATPSAAGVASAHGAMAELYEAEDKWSLAQVEWLHALEAERSLFGDSHPQTGFIMSRLAVAYAEEDEFPPARDYGARAVESMRGSLGDDSPVTGLALANLAFVEQRASAFNAAALHYESAVRTLRQHPDQRGALCTVLRRYAGLLKTMHRSREAKALATEVKSFGQN